MGRNYTSEFKEEAKKLGKEIGSGEAAKKLEIPEGTLDCWLYKERKAEKRESGTGKKEEGIRVRELEERIGELERENARMKKENEFLEEASRFFASRRQK
jgi:transposase